MALRDKYNEAIQTAKGVHMEGSADERDGKLYFHGTVETQDQINKIWNAIKTVPDWKTDIVADIKATGTAAPAARASQGQYTVMAGDTLSKIAKEHLGDGSAYMKIFEANRGVLTNPDQIKPGQVLNIPQAAK